MPLPSRRHGREKASESEGRSQCTGEGERIRWTMDDRSAREKATNPMDNRYSLLSRNTNEQRTIVSYYYTFMVWLLLLFHRVPQVMEDDGSSVRETGVTETKSKEFSGFVCWSARGCLDG